jgi:hypothetical protein
MTVLRRDLSLVTALALPSWSAGPAEGDDVAVAAAGAGYAGLQVFLPDQAARARELGLAASAISPARTPSEVEAIVGMWAGGQAESVTLHLGTGFETPAEASALVRCVLDAQERHGVAALVETHRATLFQDPARALALVAEFPALRFTADLSHWYTGVELVYGDFDAKVAALAPVFERCRMVHGRISDPGCIQVAVTDPADGEPEPEHVTHFRRLWAAVLDACSSAVDAPAELPFVVELLPARAHYARTIERGGRREEEVDRWTQAEVLWRIATSPASVAAAP